MDSCACDGCLGTHVCWICTGEGCHRCQGSGSCHLCTPRRITALVPPQRDEQAASTVPLPASRPLALPPH